MTRLVRTHDGWAVDRDGRRSALGASLGDLLALPLSEARARCEAADGPAAEAPLRAPVDVQEVWAAGVTYQRSREGRREESEHAGHAGLYDHVYNADRPEVFFKATAGRVVGDGEPVGIRADSGWDVPEAELGLVVNAAGEVFGYTVGNDMSSRSIEGRTRSTCPRPRCTRAPARSARRSCRSGRRDRGRFRWRCGWSGPAPRCGRPRRRQPGSRVPRRI
ncbi:hypothetical protein Phou_002760 [Phytohabitans houttuyneae]|uniref:Fumarylacetoacetase-like C-terminal domain-containing protein n=1 Tax=Phytohabitans houttuyneae TaxID=1076126 RepID=A0A6V8K2B6_9ACTN|nr:hypothetical protein Phou_002760 [Phytohabitans houttuyneae]